MEGWILHEIYFYKDPQGHEPVLEFIKELSHKNDKKDDGACH